MILKNYDTKKQAPFVVEVLIVALKMFIIEKISTSKLCVHDLIYQTNCDGKVILMEKMCCKFPLFFKIENVLNLLSDTCLTEFSFWWSDCTCGISRVLDGHLFFQIVRNQSLHN